MTTEIKKCLEYLREEIIAKRISYEEISELQSLIPLLIVKRLYKLYDLRDCNGFRIGIYESPEEAESWAKENGYRTKRDFK